VYDLLESLNGMNVVVVGGARGMGASIATGFRQAGSNVVVLDQLNAGSDGDGSFVSVDIRTRAAVTAAFLEIDKRFDRLDVVINTVGITGKTAPVEEISVEEWNLVLAVNLSGHFWVAQEAAQRMIPRGRGSIVNFSSVSALRIIRGQQHAHYNITKAAQIAMTEALAQEWGTFGIRLNVIAPGTHMTEIVRELYDFDEAKLAAKFATVAAVTPLGRVADASEIVPLTLFLASDAAGYITGVVIKSDGGRGLGYD